jgi:biotin operon repressor
MAKTIKEIADELGVSKTAVSKQIANLGLRSSLRKNGNQFAIENQQEKLIKMAFQKKRQQEIVTENPVSDEQSQTKSQTKSQTANANKSQTANHEVCDLVGVLQTTVDTLQAQLAVKDVQIRELNARLAECSTALLAAQETARAAQALHAGTIQQQLSDGEDRAAASVPDGQAAPNNRRWFSRFFRR